MQLKGSKSKKQDTKRSRAGVCKDCGGTENVRHAPCPYASEINDDDTPVWLCTDCRHERAQDI